MLKPLPKTLYNYTLSIKSTNSPNSLQKKILHQKKNKLKTSHSNFLDRTVSAYKMSTIIFFPHCPPNASMNDIPPILLPTLLLHHAKVEQGIAQLIPNKQNKMCSRFIVVLLHCRNKRSLLSPSCSYKGHLEQI